MNKEDRLNAIRKDLSNSNDILNALCDNNRQKILLVLLDNCSDGGIRVIDIAKRVNLSRPAVSHHLKVLLDNNIVTIEHVGPMNFYHIAGLDKILSLKSLLNNIEMYVKERNEEIK